MEKEIELLKKEHVDGLLIDLRNNGKSIIKVESDKLISLKENNPITINHKSNKTDDNLIISQTGNTKSSLVLLSEGNTNNAINLNSKNGVILATASLRKEQFKDTSVISPFPFKRLAFTCSFRNPTIIWTQQN